MIGPEERLARRLVERFSLVPPIDIEALAATYAKVSSLAFPVDVDGVTLYAKSPVRKPEILINEAQPRRRWRFTLAHELGHVLIPGHTGSVIDTINISEKEESEYREKEAEANRFAAELLMPTDWSLDLIGVPSDMAEVVKKISEAADVSVEAATIKAIKVGPPGFIVAREKAGIVAWSGKTSGTKANKPYSGQLISRDLISPIQNYSVIRNSAAVYHWWKVAEEVDFPPVPERPWRDILDDIINSLELVNEKKARQSVNGIISAANSFTKGSRSHAVIYAACLHKLKNRSHDSSDVSAILVHPLFEQFLVARVSAFSV